MGTLVSPLPSLEKCIETRQFSGCGADTSKEKTITMNLRSFFTPNLFHVALFGCAIALIPAAKMHAATLSAPAVVECSEASGTIMSASVPTGAVIYYTVTANGSLLRSGSYSLSSSTTFYTIWVEESDVTLVYSAYATYQGSTSATSSCTVTF
jgi:hypothetical protein